MAKSNQGGGFYLKSKLAEQSTPKVKGGSGLIIYDLDNVIRSIHANLCFHGIFTLKSNLLIKGAIANF